MENQKSKHRVQSWDSVPASPVTASAEEIRYAQHLRERIEQRYLNQPVPPVPAWTVGVDRA